MSRGKTTFTETLYGPVPVIKASYRRGKRQSRAGVTRPNPDIYQRGRRTLGAEINARIVGERKPHYRGGFDAGEAQRAWSRLLRAVRKPRLKRTMRGARARARRRR